MHAGGKTPSFLLLNVQLFQKIRTFVSDLWNESILTRKTNGFIIETKRKNARHRKTDRDRWQNNTTRENKENQHGKGIFTVL